jgi:hypothetical protein
MKPEAPVTQTVFPAIPVFSSLLRTPSPLLFLPPKRKMGSNQKERKMQTTNQTKAQ